MNMSTPEIEELKKYIQKKFGKQLKTTTDFEEFSLHIGKADSSVSASTLKRLFGYVGDSHKPRVQTLNLLAKYIGHYDFDTFVEWLKRSSYYNSSFFQAGQIVSSELQQGDRVEIGWAPNRMLLLDYLGNSTYRVLESHNSKVQPDDRFITGCFIKGSPLYLPFIERQGKRTAPFVAGRNGGLTIITVDKKQ